MQIKTIEQIGNIEWGSVDGRVTKIKDMDVGHLVNCINWIKKHPENFKNPIKLHAELESYAKYISFFLFCDKKSYPLKNEQNGKWYIFNVESGKTEVHVPPKEYLDYVKENCQDMDEFADYFTKYSERTDSLT